ncbi:MAG: TonB-dependent receptor [Myxococcota bacterium]|nr:TonB-dependent receptor [Myxococcota bacterium]
MVLFPGGESVRTSREGGFRLQAPEGEFRLTIRVTAKLEMTTPVVPVFRNGVTEVVVTVDTKTGQIDTIIEASAGQAMQGALDDPSVPRVALKGQITQAGTGKPIKGAQVYVRGLMDEAVTDVRGAFALQVPVGTLDVTVVHQGHATNTTRGIEVGVDGKLDLAIEMQPAAFDLGVMVVTAPRIEGSTLSLLQERKDAKAVADIIGAEQMAKSGDTTAAAALRRVTGVTLVGGKFVYVRGLGERYSATLLNGAMLPSPDPERRVVPLDLFPAGVLESVVIQKTWSPDRPGEFGGGSVQLRTRTFPQEFKAKVGFSLGGQFGTWLGKVQRGDESGSTDFLGIDDGTRAMPQSLISASENSKLIPGSRFKEGYSPEELEAFGEALSNNWKLRNDTLAMPNMKLNTSIGDSFSVGKDTRLGYLASVAWSNAHTFIENEVQNTFAWSDANQEVAPLNSFKLDTYTNTVSLTALGSVGVEVGENHQIRALGMVTRTTDNEIRTQEGFGWDADGDMRVRRFWWLERMLAVGQLTGHHEWPSVQSLALDWRYTVAGAYRDEPDRRTVRYDYDETRDVWFFSNSPDGNQRVRSGLEDLAHDIGVDMSVNFDQWGGLKSSVDWGGNLVIKDRQVDTRRYSYVQKGALPPDALLLEPEDLLSPEYIGPGQFQIQEQTQPTDNYNAGFLLAGGYATLDLPLSESVSLNTGLRIEYWDQTVSTFVPFDEDSVSETRKHTLDVLPSAAFRWDIRDDMVMRFGFSRTASRPDFREMSEASFQAVAGGAVWRGNPEVDAATLTHADVRWEWYPTKGQSISLGGFYKHFDNPIEVVVRPGTELVVSVANVPVAHSAGVEFDFRTSLDFIHGSLRDLYLSGNASYIFSQIDLSGSQTTQTTLERPLQGQSPWVVNAQLSYENVEIGTNVNLLYNVYGRRIVGVGTLGLPDTYEEPFHQMDVVFRQKLPLKFAITLKLRNLLNLHARTRLLDKTVRRFLRGRTFSLGLSKSF